MPRLRMALFDEKVITTANCALLAQTEADVSDCVTRVCLSNASVEEFTAAQSLFLHLFQLS